jgi:hypothetical protein
MSNEERDLMRVGGPTGGTIRRLTDPNEVPEPDWPTLRNLSRLKSGVTVRRALSEIGAALCTLHERLRYIEVQKAIKQDDWRKNYADGSE